MKNNELKKNFYSKMNELEKMMNEGKTIAIYDYELVPTLSSQKSFYKKAYYKMIKFEDSEGVMHIVYKLWSYESLVAIVHKNTHNGYEMPTNEYYIDEYIPLVYSATSLRHIKDFIYKASDFKITTKKDVQKLQGVELQGQKIIEYGVQKEVFAW